MARTLENAPEILSPASITRALINTTTAGSALITKVIAGAGVAIASTGADAGTGDVTLSVTGAFVANGAASSPPVKASGTWFTGGTSATTKPQVLIEPSAATSTGWNVNGTGLGVNAATGFVGLLADLQVNGATKWNVDATGASRFYAVSDAAVVNFERLATSFSGGGFNLLVEAGGTGASRSMRIGTNTSSSGGLFIQTSGVNRWAVNGSTGALESQAVGLTLGFGGGTADTILSRPGAANLQQGAADAAAPVAQTFSVQSVVAGTTNTAGADRIISASKGTGTGVGGGIRLQVAPAGTTGSAQNALADALVIDSTKLATFSGAVKTTAVNFAQLPSASAVGAGAIHFVLDSMTSKLTGQGTAAAGGGANKVPVYSDGTSWMIN